MKTDIENTENTESAAGAGSSPSSGSQICLAHGCVSEIALHGMPADGVTVHFMGGGVVWQVPKEVIEDQGKSRWRLILEKI